MFPLNQKRIIKLGETLELAKEEQITLIINGEGYHIMCTPEHINELILGFLISEGFASDLKEIKFSNSTCLKSRIFVVDVSQSLLPITLRSSGCIGVLRKGEKLPKIAAREKFSMDEIRNSLDYLEIEEYRKTRGYHVAALVGKGGLIFRAYDVGRHNAVDKVIGMAVKNDVDFSKTFLVISGRISRGMALKCARVGIPLIVSRAAILDSAIEVCIETGLSAISFATNVVVNDEILINTISKNE